MKPDLGKVRERMVDLEDHHEEAVSIEDVMARLLEYDGDPDTLGRAVMPEVRRAILLLDTVYARMGLPPTKPTAAAIGFLQGVTFATAFRDVAASAGENGAALARMELDTALSRIGASDHDVRLCIQRARAAITPGAPNPYGNA